MSHTIHHKVADLLVGAGSILCAFPLFIFFNHRLPMPGWPLMLDRILLMLTLILLLVFILRLFRPLMLFFTLLLLGFLAYGSLEGQYGFGRLYRDYRALLYGMAEQPGTVPLFLPNFQPFPHRSEIEAAITPENPRVRQFAVAAANKYFRENEAENPEYRNLIQCLAVFRQINSRWNYVSDPLGEEYFAPAAESVKLMAGDCDDHAILMASCIKAIGGRPRLVLTTGHLYPELYIGHQKNLPAINYLIRQQLFKKQSGGQELHYHQDPDGKIWINLDYTAPYPGGPFMATPVKGILLP